MPEHLSHSRQGRHTLLPPSARPHKDRCTSHSTGCVQVGVTQRGALVHHMGATVLWALGPFGPTLQGLDQIFFFICHNQAMLGVGEQAEGLDQALVPRAHGTLPMSLRFHSFCLTGFMLLFLSHLPEEEVWLVSFAA